MTEVNIVNTYFSWGIQIRDPVIPGKFIPGTFSNKVALLSHNACLYQTFDFRVGSSACSKGNMHQMAKESVAAVERIS